MLRILGQLQKSSGVNSATASAHCLFLDSLCIEMFDTEEILLFPR